MTFTAIVRYPGEPPRHFRYELLRTTRRPPGVLRLPSFVDETDDLDTFVLESALSWPTVALYVRQAAEPDQNPKSPKSPPMSPPKSPPASLPE